MIKPKLKDFVSPDVADVRRWTPTSADDVCFYLEMTIGSAEAGADLFGITVISTKALLERAKTGPVWGRHYLIVEDFDWDDVKRCIEERIQKCSGDSWKEVAEKLSRYFAWEYEDYKEGA